METAYDLLEQHLGNAEVVTWTRETIPGGAHTHKAAGLLSGGVWVIAKFAQDVAHGEIAVKNETAAYRIARLLGWPDLVPCTVLRKDLTSPQTDEEGAASIQVHIPETDHDTFDGVTDEDIWRAAAFDVVVQHTDHTHNWLTVPGNTNERRHLYLYDNAMAFEYPGRNFSSVFARRKDREGLPEFVKDGLKSLVANLEDSGLDELIDEEGVRHVEQRAEDLLTSGVLRIP